MFQRKIYEKMKKWKEESAGRTALLIEGARRIGKSTIVEEFGKNEYSSYILIDFAFASESVKTLFDDLSDLDYLFLQLQLIYHVDLENRKSLIILDEVQFCPKARQAVKILVKDHRYDYIETGSLISIRKNVKDILIPSEERRIDMFPMDFEEFLWATGDSVSYELIHKCFESMKSVGTEAHRRLMRAFRLYMLVGGMPQAVNEYIETYNFRKVDLVKRDIIKLYEEDFNKIDSTGRAARIFHSIPAQLNSNASRFLISGVVKDARAKSVEALISEMENSKTVLVSHQNNDPGAGMSAHQNLSAYKLFLSDTGLFVTLMFMDRDFTENDIYQKLLSDKMPANLGYLYENIVAQMLVSGGNELFYHTMRNEQTKHNYEIDFLIARKNKICPIEVKSSGYKTHTSIDVFSEKFSDRISQKYLVYTKEFAKEKNLLCIPVYMVPFL